MHQVSLSGAQAWLIPSASKAPRMRKDLPSPQADIPTPRVPSTEAVAQAPRVHKGVPSTKASAQAPRVRSGCPAPRQDAQASHVRRGVSAQK